MPYSIGQIIKRLRKERNYTQEELAELLNISSQSVSKWENESSMPDISQIVPIAHIFGVSTDILFGIHSINDADEVKKIIDYALALVYDSNGILKKDGLYNCYIETQEGLKRYPNNITLLMFSLERGLSLAYPDNDCYDQLHAKKIYEESIRQANIVISHCKQTTDVLRTHMIMVLMHSIHGNISQAWEHANQFPWRADMTIHEMSAYIVHAESNYTDESLYCQRDFMYHLEAMLDNNTQNGCAYFMLGNYSDALTAFTSVFNMIELIFKNEKYLPPLHIRERGDVHVLIAQTYIMLKDNSNALIWLEKMVDYEIKNRKFFTNDMYVQTPLLRDVKYTFYWNHRSPKGYLEVLLSNMNDLTFKNLKDHQKLIELVNRVNIELESV